MKTNLLMVLVFLLLGSCSKVELNPSTPTTTDVAGSTVEFAMIGDYGYAGEAELKVSEMVKTWSPEFIVTLGDNNYESGSLATIQDNISQYYCDYIYNPDAPKKYQCLGTAWNEKQNRFFPSLGNHDQQNADYSQPYLSFFTLPGKETYYEFKWGPVHFFTVNSGRYGEATCCDSEQALWLKEKLMASTLPFKLVFFHHSPFSASYHGSNENMQWPFREWGASLVVTGHSHLYEKITKIEYPNFPYIVNGLGGRLNIHSCESNPLDLNLMNHFCYNESHGALHVRADSSQMEIKFLSIDDLENPIDGLVITK